MLDVGLLALGKKAYTALIHAKEHNTLKSLNFVVIGEDKAVEEDYSLKIKELCHTENIIHYSRADFTEKAPNCNYLIAIGWRWLVDTQKYKLVTLHDSLLPAYRGFNPLVTALIEGDRQIGVTAILANEEIDAGSIIVQESMNIDYPLKINEAIDLVSILYGKIFVNILKSNEIITFEQDHSAATYSLWRNEDDYLIDWKESSDRIIRTIDALGFPYKGAYTNYDKKIVRVLKAEEIEDIKIINRTPGKILTIKNNCPTIVCGKGLIVIKKAIYDIAKTNVVFNKLRVKLQ